jgi:hypothetical protein
MRLFDKMADNTTDTCLDDCKFIAIKIQSNPANKIVDMLIKR